MSTSLGEGEVEMEGLGPLADQPRAAGPSTGSAASGGASGAPTGGGVAPSPLQPLEGVGLPADVPGEGLTGAGTSPMDGHPQGPEMGGGIDEKRSPTLTDSGSPPLLDPPLLQIEKRDLSQAAAELSQSETPVEEVSTEEGVDILQALADSADASWLHRAVALMEDAAPVLLAIGLAALQPEAAAIVVEELGADVAEAADAALSWAQLQLPSSSAAPVPASGTQPTTVSELIEQLRRQLEKPSLGVKGAEHKLPKKAKDVQRLELERKAKSWAAQRSKDEWREWKRQLAAWKAQKAAAAQQQKDGSIEDSELDLPVGSVAAVVPDASKMEPPPMTKEGRIWVKTGSHSIVATDITGELFLEDESTAVGPPNLFATYAQGLRDNVTNFAFVAGQGYQIQSWVAESEAGGGTAVPQQIAGVVFPSTAAPIPIGNPVARHDLHIHTGAAREVERFTQAHIAGLYQGGRPSERFVTSAINPELHITNLNALKALTSYVEQAWEVYDNTLLYAKLLYYVFLHDLFTAQGNAPAANAFAGIQLTWTNISDANLGIDVMPNAIVRRDLVLVEGSDIFVNDNDLQLVYWIASSGMRFDGPANGATPNAVYVEWPAIPVTVWSRRAQPAQPGAAVLNSTAVLSFASRLAAERREWRWFVKGAYMAMEILGVRLPHHGGQWWPVRSNWSAHNPYSPGFSDYNALFRALKVYPPDDDSSKMEADVFISLSAACRVRIAALYNAVLQTAATTLLYDLNVSTALLVQWCTGDADTPRLFATLMQEALNNPCMEEGHFEAVACAHPRKAFKLWLGCGVAEGFWYEDTWNGDFNQTEGANNAYAGLQQAVAPRVMSTFVIDAWLSSRPMEWGIVGMRPAVNFTQDMRVVGAAANQGWYGSKGSTKYAERACSQFPCKMTVYGTQAVNIISEVLRRAAGAALVLSHQNASWSAADTAGNTSDVAWDAPVAYAVADVPYIAALHVFQPCTIMTFDFVNEQVWAPCVVGNTLGAADKRALMAYKGQPADLAGFLLQAAGAPARPFALPGLLNMRAVGAFKAKTTTQSRGRTMDDSNAERASAADQPSKNV